MNFKKIGLSAAIAAATIAGGVAATTPAEAATLLNFTGSARLKKQLGPTSVLDFNPFNGTVTSTTVGTGTGTTTSSTASLFGPVGSSITLKDLKLTKTGSAAWTLASVADGADFISGLVSGAKYSLTSFELIRTGAGATREYTANYDGFFTGLVGYPDATGDGTLRASGDAFITGVGARYGSTVTVPTPALLPGLIGMGVAALRKRKGEGSEAETAEVKA